MEVITIASPTVFINNFIHHFFAMYVRAILHLFAKGLKHARMTNITECRPQNARSWTTLLSTSTPIRAIKTHCRIKSGQTAAKGAEGRKLGWLVVRLKHTTVDEAICVQMPPAHESWPMNEGSEQCRS